MISTEELEDRLRTLPSQAHLRAEDERAIAEIRPWRVAARRRRTMRIAVRITATATAVLLANLAAAYYAPRYDRALADSPIGPASQRFLDGVGLQGAEVTAVGDSATSAGHTIVLAGAYADGLRTVMLLSIDGRGLSGNPKTYGLTPGDYGVNPDDVSLTDQFGRSYGGAGTSGPTDLQFGALTWPASTLGGRLTLHITGIWAVWKVAELPHDTSFDAGPFTVHGDWTLHATLFATTPHAIAFPTPLHTPMADFTFTGIVASETEMVVHWTASGPLVDQTRLAPSPDKSSPAAGYTHAMQQLAPAIYDSHGIQLQIEEWGYEWPKTSGPAEGDLSVFIKGPGRYRIQFGGAPSSPDQERWVEVP